MQPNCTTHARVTTDSSPPTTAGSRTMTAPTPTAAPSPPAPNAGKTRTAPTVLRDSRNGSPRASRSRRCKRKTDSGGRRIDPCAKTTYGVLASRRSTSSAPASARRFPIQEDSPRASASAAGKSRSSQRSSPAWIRQLQPSGSSTATVELSSTRPTGIKYEGEKREQAKKLEALVLAALDEEGTPNGEETPQGLNQAVSEDGRYWARTSDPQLVDPLRRRRLGRIRGH